MTNERAWEALYDTKRLRPNANIEGALVVALAGLSAEADELRRYAELLGITDPQNPLDAFLGPYLELTRAISMKGSEQVVRSFGGWHKDDPEGVGLAPNLRPRGPQDMRQNGAIYLAVQGSTEAVKDANKGRRKFGLGR